MARILGLDEAGRGSVLGPLVVGGFLVDEERLSELVETGATDSKALDPNTRERIVAVLPTLGECDTVVLPPREIDQYVSLGRLNDLEARAFGTLVSRLHPDEVHADACDTDPHRFGRMIAKSCGPTRARILAHHHADRDDPIVGAASIVAKVRRDAAIRRLSQQLGVDIGSGYPSDPRTIQFLRVRLAAEHGCPAWARASWSTMQRVIPERPARTLDAYES